MKRFALIVSMAVCSVLAAEEKEMWYDASGQAIGELPADHTPTTQPRDLVANNQLLLRAAGEPWGAGRRSQRLRDWYIDGWNSFGRWGIGTGWFFRRSCVQPRFDGNRGNACGNSWGVSYRSPGFSLQWCR